MIVFKETGEFQKYLKENTDLFIGKTIDGIFIDKLFAEEEFFDFDDKSGKHLFWDKNANEDVEFEIDKTLTIKISDAYINIDNDWINNSNYDKKSVKITITESIQNNLLNISHYYSKNIIGYKIVKITTDDYYTLTILLNNGFEFNIISKAERLIYTHDWLSKEKKQINYDTLCRYEKYSILNKYINSIKNDIVGRKIEKIMRLGTIFEYDENRCIMLDEAIDIKIGDIHLNIEFNYDSDTFFGINLFDGSETSYFDGFSWRSMNCIYKDNIINQTIKDIVLTKQDIGNYIDKEYAKQFEDDFKAIQIILENGYMFQITNWEDYMVLDEKRS